MPGSLSYSLILLYFIVRLLSRDMFRFQIYQRDKYAVKVYGSVFALEPCQTGKVDKAALVEWSKRKTKKLMLKPNLDVSTPNIKSTQLKAAAAQAMASDDTLFTRVIVVPFLDSNSFC